MKNATHRVVILKDINSDIISQAIIFLKDSCPESGSKILSEAELIVEKYMASAHITTSLPVEKGNKAYKKIIKFASIGILSVAVIGIVIALM